MKMKTYIFHRGEMWYPIELRDDNDAEINALHNKGTTKVTDIDGNVIWSLSEEINLSPTNEQKQ